MTRISVKSFPGSSRGFMHPKVGGLGSGSNRRGPSIPHGALPVRQPNPYKSAKTMLNRSVGLSKGQKGRPY